VTILVASYFWSPDPGSKFAAPYTADDVRRLQRMVAKNCSVPHEFAVITDRPELFAEDADIRAIPIDKTTHVPGTCYVRLMTFHPAGQELFGADKLLQIDLDTLIVGNIDHLVTREEDLVMWRNPARIPWDNPTMPGRCYYNTSCLLHRLGTMPDIWQNAAHGYRGNAKDDQWYLSNVLGSDWPYFDGTRDGVYRIAREDTPGSGVSGTLPENACIVTCPGSEGKASDPRVQALNPWIEAHLS
jgi:hypothetical protein